VLSPLKQAVLDLSLVRTDGWLEQLASEIPEFGQLCELLGHRFVAFSFIAGVRINAIAYDSQAPASSQVEFEVGDEPSRERLTLVEFRELLGTLLTAQESEPLGPVDLTELEAEHRLDELRAWIGRRYLMLAPVFGIQLTALHMGTGEGMPMLEIDLGHARELISLAGLRDILEGAVRAEIARARPAAPFSIDFKRIPQAEAANARGDYEETISLLGAWPGPLSMLLRSAQGQSLGWGERSRLVQALGLLGQAYMSKQQTEWAEDVLRLGIQFGQELEAAGPLFGWLGKVRVETGRYGEAIGLLRRALALMGTQARPRDCAELHVDLARCFYERKRFVAALVCLDTAQVAEEPSERIASLRSDVQAALGDAYVSYRAVCDSTTP